MPISDESVKEFMVLVKEEYGKELTFEAAREWGQNIVNFYSCLAKINARTNTI